MSGLPTALRLRTPTWIRLLAVLVAMFLVSLLVVERSTSAFSSTTSNSKNSLATGSVLLTDDDASSALFEVAGMTGGQNETRCITVKYEGTSAVTAVKLYGSSVTSTLSPYLDMVIQRGGPGSTCAAQGTLTTIFDAASPTASTGTLAAFTTNHPAYATGISTGWTPAASSNDTRAFVIAFTVKDDNSAQAKSTGQLTFTWEVRS